MDKIFDLLIHDKHVKRKIDILRILSGQEEFISSEELAFQINCTSRTILNDISQLKIDLPNHSKLVSKKSVGHKLEKLTNNDYSDIINSYLMDSISYQIFEGLFENKIYSLEKWSQTLYVNKQTIRNVLNKFIPILKQSNLKIKLNPIRFVGAEENIRHFYHALFSSIQKNTNKYKLQDKLRRDVENKLGEYRIQINIELLIIIIMVCVKRISFKNHVKMERNIKIIFDNYQWDCFNEILSTIEMHYQIKLSKKERDVFLLYCFLASKGTDKQRVDILNHIKGQHENYLDLLKEILNINNLNGTSREKLALHLGFTLFKIHIMCLNKLPVDYFIEEIDLPEHLKKIYNKNIKLLSEWNEKINENQFAKFEVEYLALNIVYILETPSPSVKGVLLYSGSIVEELIIQQNLNRQLGKSVYICTEWSAEHEYDFIITNHLKIDAKLPFFSISSKLNSKEIIGIKQLIDNITSRKLSV